MSRANLEAASSTGPDSSSAAASPVSCAYTSHYTLYPHALECSQTVQSLPTHSELEGRAGDVRVHVLDADGVHAQLFGHEVDTEQTLLELQGLGRLAITLGGGDQGRQVEGADAWRREEW